MRIHMQVHWWYRLWSGTCLGILAMAEEGLVSVEWGWEAQGMAQRLHTILHCHHRCMVPNTYHLPYILALCCTGHNCNSHRNCNHNPHRRLRLQKVMRRRSTHTEVSSQCKQKITQC